jgi:hypothetical protein
MSCDSGVAQRLTLLPPYVFLVIGRKPWNSTLSTYGPGGRAGNQSCPLSFVVMVAGPPISAGEVARTNAPGMTAPCSSLIVPMRAPVKLCRGSHARQENACGDEDHRKAPLSLRH